MRHIGVNAIKIPLYPHEIMPEGKREYDFEILYRELDPMVERDIVPIICPHKGNHFRDGEIIDVGGNEVIGRHSSVRCWEPAALRTPSGSIWMDGYYLDCFTEDAYRFEPILDRLVAELTPDARKVWWKYDAMHIRHAFVPRFVVQGRRNNEGLLLAIISLIRSPVEVTFWLDLRAFGMDEDKDFAVTDLVTTKPILEKVTSGDAGVLELTLILEAHEHYILSIR
ncbi:MAG TPA: hypothetical protein EYP53_09320 [Candidatus Latescibacteria bacterium]|nr:hypothetical protein [Candidatus Latescibacterota bacterium]